MPLQCIYPASDVSRSPKCLCDVLLACLPSDLHRSYVKTRQPISTMSASHTPSTVQIPKMVRIISPATSFRALTTLVARPNVPWLCTTISLHFVLSACLTAGYSGHSFELPLTQPYPSSSPPPFVLRELCLSFILLPRLSVTTFLARPASRNTLHHVGQHGLQQDRSVQDGHDQDTCRSAAARRYPKFRQSRIKNARLNHILRDPHSLHAWLHHIAHEY